MVLSCSCRTGMTPLDERVRRMASDFRSRCGSFSASYGLVATKREDEIVGWDVAELTEDEFFGVLSRARTILLSDLHGYSPVSTANLELVRRLLAMQSVRYGALEMLYMEWEQDEVDAIQRNVDHTFADFTAEHGLEWVSEVVASCRRNAVAVVGLNTSALDDPSFTLRFDLDRLQFAELAAERLRERDRWAAQRLAAQGRAGFAICGRDHCLQPDFVAALPGCVTVFMNDFALLDRDTVRAITARRSASEPVFVRMGKNVVAAYVPSWGDAR
jgi:hypothetical protein